MKNKFRSRFGVYSIFYAFIVLFAANSTATEREDRLNSFSTAAFPESESSISHFIISDAGEQEVWQAQAFDRSGSVVGVTQISVVKILEFNDKATDQMKEVMISLPGISSFTERLVVGRLDSVEHFVMGRLVETRTDNGFVSSVLIPIDAGLSSDELETVAKNKIEANKEWTESDVLEAKRVGAETASAFLDWESSRDQNSTFQDLIYDPDSAEAELIFVQDFPRGQRNFECLSEAHDAWLARIERAHSIRVIGYAAAGALFTATMVGCTATGAVNPLAGIWCAAKASATLAGAVAALDYNYEQDADHADTARTLDLLLCELCI